MFPTLQPTANDPIADPYRLAAVLSTGLLDTEPEASFDDLTRLASLLIGAPFAFATFVDNERSFWKSRHGIPADGPRQNTIQQSFCQYVVRGGGKLIVNNAATDERTRDNPSVEAMGIGSWAGFPLYAPGGEVLGTFCVVDTRTREWTDAEIDILSTLARIATREIARQISVNAERAARTRAEALTHTVQAGLLPPAIPNVPGLDVSARFHAAGVGLDLVGDFYDVFATSNGWSFLIGDVCGKGLEAAKAATLARNAVGAASTRVTAPVDIMHFLNHAFSARRADIDLFLTAIYGTLDLRADGCEIKLACAGHLPPVIRRANGASELLDVSGPLIGVFAELQISEATVMLHPGDSLIVYTDGITEARGTQGVFGDDAVNRIVDALPIDARAEAIASAIERAALDHAGGVASDDIALVVIRVPLAA